MVSVEPNSGTVRIRYGQLSDALRAYLFVMPRRTIAICENKECPAPFYYRNFGKQRFCSRTDECARSKDDRQRQANREYYRSKGAERRRLLHGERKKAK